MSGVIASILIGALAGYIASKFFDGNSKGFLVNAVLGIVGGLVGSSVFSLLDISSTGVIGDIISAVVGAVIILWVWSKIK